MKVQTEACPLIDLDANISIGCLDIAYREIFSASVRAEFENQLMRCNHLVTFSWLFLVAHWQRISVADVQTKDAAVAMRTERRKPKIVITGTKLIDHLRKCRPCRLTRSRPSLYL